MTGEQLREELARIAQAAPEVHVPDDVFTRGRRATLRARVLVAAAAVACLGLVVGLGAQVLRSDEAPVADRDSGGVPDVIYAPPDGDFSDLPEAALEDVGPVVAAYQVEDGQGTIVVVTAEGHYRIVELPSLEASAFDDNSVLLSPDGNRLAYYFRNGPSWGLALVDLTTGAVQRVPLEPPLGAIVRTEQWSPDSELLAWSGQAVKSRSGNGASYRSEIIGGVITFATGRTRALPAGGRAGWDGLGVCNDGATIRYVWPVFLAQIGTQQRPSRARSWQRIATEHGDCSAPSSYAPVGGDDEHLLGWLPGDTEPTAVVLRPNWTDDREDSYDSHSLGLAERDGSVRDVGTVESSWVSDVTVAIGLMSADRPTVPAGTSPWARSWWIENRVELAILALLVAGLGALAVWQRRRVRR